jgi:uncharacterized protein YegL
MRLEHPALMLAAPPVLLALLLLARRGTGPGRRPAAAFALRFLILMALAAALAAPSVAARPPGPSVVFALDVSDSVSDEALERAVEAIRDASKAVAARGGASSLVLFAGRAAVARPPSPEPIDFGSELRGRIFSRRAAKEAASEDRAPAAGAPSRDELDPLRTRAASALLLARRLHPSGADSRTVLITDGEETEIGSAPPVDATVRVVRFPELPASDVALRALRTPLAVRAGEAFDVEVDAWADRDTEARLALTLDGQVVAEDPAPRLVRAGRSTLLIRSVQNALPQGLHRLQAVVSADKDIESRNNAASASFHVVGKSRVLIVEATPAEGEGLSRLLAAQGIEFERRPVELLAAGGVDLDSWAVVVIAGASPAMIPPSAAKALGEWLEDGGGLFFVASSAPPGPKGFDRPEFTRLLPVELEAPKPAAKPEGAPGPPGPPTPPPPDPAPAAETRKVLAPAVALLLVIDKSGSMAGEPITLCKEAALATLETLGEKDYLGVLAFDRQAVWLQKFEAAHRTEVIRRNILQLFADGGTDLMPALEAARKAFQEQEFARTAGVKHIIILSDGDVLPGEYEKAVRRLSDEGVVVTSVCVIGPGGFKDQLMRNISQWGKGRYFFADSFKKVPRIFTEETKFVLKEAVAKVESGPKPPPPPAPAPPAPPADPKPAPDPAPPPPEAVAPGAGGKVAFKDDHEVIRGIPKEPAPPPLKGALAGTARKTSYVPLAFEDGAPALALWRFGLGRTAVWMSDIGGPWSAGWDRWPGTTKLFVQIVRHLSNAAEDIGLASAVRAERSGNAVEFRVDNDVTVHELSPQRRELAPIPDPEGARRFILPLDGGDVRHVSIARVTDGRTDRLTLEFAPGPPPEIAAPPDRPPAFAWTSEAPAPLSRLATEALPSGASGPESRTPVGAAFLLAALLLIPLDVAVRRIP